MLEKLTNQLGTGNMNFFDNFLPGIPVGDYTITVAHSLSVNSSDSNKQPPAVIPTILQGVTITGSRFLLNDSDIHSYYPPPNSSGLYNAILPHIVFNNSMIPWEVEMKSGATPTPWLALLVLEENDLKPNLPPGAEGVTNTFAFTSTAQQLFATSTDNVFIPALTINDFEKNLSCKAIRISKDLFTNITPNINELAYLCHTRQVNSGDIEELGEQDKGWFSVAIANRFPKPPDISTNVTTVNNIVHLVSLEGFSSSLPPNSSTISQTQVQLISLASWSFNCLPMAQENFGQLTQNLHTDVLRLSPPADGQTPEEHEIYQRLAMGYVPTNYTARSGESTFAWYRGPLSPVAVPMLDALSDPIPLSYSSNITIPRQADGLGIYNGNFGTFDHSYSAAWNLGRQLALSDADFTQALLTFRLQNHNVARTVMAAALSSSKELNSYKKSALPDRTALVVKALQGEEGEGDCLAKEGLVTGIRKMTHGQLPLNSPKTEALSPKKNSTVLREKRTKVRSIMKSAIDANMEDIQLYQPWYDKIKQWLIDLRQLSTVPFHYLIANSNLLPAESMRFFYVDPNWLEVLTEGALSIGIHSNIDYEINAALKNQLLNDFTQKDPKSGILISSSLIIGWPGLVIQTTPGAATTSILRKESLSTNTLLCLFNDIPGKITLSEPAHQLRFGVNNADSGFGKAYLEIRNLTGAIGSPVETYALSSIPNFFRPEIDRVINISSSDSSGLLSTLSNKIITPPTNLSPAQFALQMINAAESAVFTLAQPQQPLALAAKAHPKKLIVGVDSPNTLLNYNFATDQLIVDQPETLCWEVTLPSESSICYLNLIKINLPEGSIDGSDGKSVIMTDGSTAQASVKGGDGNWKADWYPEDNPYIRVYYGLSYDENNLQCLTGSFTLDVYLVIPDFSKTPISDPLQISINEFSATTSDSSQISEKISSCSLTKIDSSVYPISDINIYDDVNPDIGWPACAVLDVKRHISLKAKLYMSGYSSCTVELYQDQLPKGDVSTISYDPSNPNPYFTSPTIKLSDLVSDKTGQVTVSYTLKVNFQPDSGSTFPRLFQKNATIIINNPKIFVSTSIGRGKELAIMKDGNTLYMSDLIDSAIRVIDITPTDPIYYKQVMYTTPDPMTSDSSMYYPVGSLFIPLDQKSVFINCNSSVRVFYPSQSSPSKPVFGAIDNSYKATGGFPLIISKSNDYYMASEGNYCPYIGDGNKIIMSTDVFYDNDLIPENFSNSNTSNLLPLAFARSNDYLFVLNKNDQCIWIFSVDASGQPANKQDYYEIGDILLNSNDLKPKLLALSPDKNKLFVFGSGGVAAVVNTNNYTTATTSDNTTVTKVTDGDWNVEVRGMVTFNWQNNPLLAISYINNDLQSPIGFVSIYCINSNQLLRLNPIDGIRGLCPYPDGSKLFVASDTGLKVIPLQNLNLATSPTIMAKPNKKSLLNKPDQPLDTSNTMNLSDQLAAHQVSALKKSDMGEGFKADNQKGALAEITFSSAHSSSKSAAKIGIFKTPAKKGVVYVGDQAPLLRADERIIAIQKLLQEFEDAEIKTSLEQAFSVLPSQQSPQRYLKEVLLTFSTKLYATDNIHKVQGDINRLDELFELLFKAPIASKVAIAMQHTFIDEQEFALDDEYLFKIKDLTKTENTSFKQ